MKCDTLHCEDEAVFDTLCGYCLDVAEIHYQTMMESCINRPSDIFED